MIDDLSWAAKAWMMAETVLSAAGSLLGGIINVISSPCHWVSLPIMVTFVTGRDRALRRRYFIHYAAAFVGGLFITIALVGIACSLPDYISGETGLYLTFALGAFLLLAGIDISGVRRYSASGNLLDRVKIQGLAGAFLLGLAYGTFSGSCSFIRWKIVAEMLLLVFLVLGYCVPMVMARSSAAKVKRLMGSDIFHDEETWFRRCAGVTVGMLGVFFMVSPLIRTS